MAGIHPLTGQKALNNPHVIKTGEIAARRQAIIDSDSRPEANSILQGGHDIIELFQGLTIDTADARQTFRSAARAIDEKNVEIAPCLVAKRDWPSSTYAQMTHACQG